VEEEQEDAEEEEEEDEEMEADGAGPEENKVMKSFNFRLYNAKSGTSEE
jgi:hypothetical protein